MQAAFCGPLPLWGVRASHILTLRGLPSAHVGVPGRVDVAAVAHRARHRTAGSALGQSRVAAVYGAVGITAVPCKP